METARQTDRRVVADDLAAGHRLGSFGTEAGDDLGREDLGHSPAGERVVVEAALGEGARIDPEVAEILALAPVEGDRVAHRRRDSGDVFDQGLDRGVGRYPWLGCDHGANIGT